MEGIKISLDATGRSGDISVVRVDGVIDTMTATELERVVVGEAERFGAQFCDVTIPTLDAAVELLRRWPHAHAFVEIKRESVRRHGTEAVVRSVLEVLRPVAARAVVISESILASLEIQDKRNESVKLANYVQRSVVSTVAKRYEDVNNQGVRNALFYVLVGARMPSVLVETSYITNPDDAKRLRSATYREYLAHGIADGVEDYFEGASPVQRVAQR